MSDPDTRVTKKDNFLAEICAFGSFVCLFLSLSALFVFFVTIDNIDFDGAIKTEFKSVEGLIDFYCILGLISVPLGFLLGTAALTMQKNEKTVRSLCVLIVMLIQGGFLGVYLWNVIYHKMAPTGGGPPVVSSVPSVESDQTKQHEFLNEN